MDRRAPVRADYSSGSAASAGSSRDTRFELLTLLGRLGLYELRAGKLC